MPDLEKDCCVPYIIKDILLDQARKNFRENSVIEEKVRMEIELTPGMIAVKKG